MRVQIKKPNEKISLEEVKAFEKKYRVLLPQDYIDFLLEFNGGDVALTVEYKHPIYCFENEFY